MGAGSAKAPPPKPRPPQDPELKAVVELEQQLWMAWKGRDLATIRRLLAPDHRCVNEDGQAVLLEDIVLNFGKLRLREVTMGRIVPHRLGPDAIVLTYNARIVGTREGKKFSKDVAEASFWSRRDGRWWNVFLHEVARSPEPSG